MRSLVPILTLLVLASAAFADERASSISLRTTVLVAPGQPITLGDIAVLDGPQAEELASAKLDLTAARADAAGWRKIDAQMVRLALEAHSPTWGTIQLRGGPCYVRTLAADATMPEASAIVLSEPVDAPALPGTVRQLAERHIAQRLQVPLGDVEVRWASATDGLLDHHTAGALAQIDDAGRSDRMALQITLYDAEANVIVQGEAKADVRVRRRVALLTRDVPRRRLIAQGDVRTERRWVGTGERLANPDELVGREAARNLKAGEPIREADVHTAVAIGRGERVQVRIITPSITARLWARATSDGRPGETITFESIAPTRGDRLRFEARVEGPGSAVAVAGAPPR